MRRVPGFLNSYTSVHSDIGRGVDIVRLQHNGSAVGIADPLLCEIVLYTLSWEWKSRLVRTL